MADSAETQGNKQSYIGVEDAVAEDQNDEVEGNGGAPAVLGHDGVMCVKHQITGWDDVEMEWKPVLA